MGEDREVQAVRGYTTLANLYLGMAYDETDHRELALDSYRRVRKLPKYQRSHELAKRYQKNAYTRGSQPADADSAMADPPDAGPAVADPSLANPSLDPPLPTSKDLE